MSTNYGPQMQRLCEPVSMTSAARALLKQARLRAQLDPDPSLDGRRPACYCVAPRRPTGRSLSTRSDLADEGLGVHPRSHGLQVLEKRRASTRPEGGREGARIRRYSRGKGR